MRCFLAVLSIVLLFTVPAPGLQIENGATIEDEISIAGEIDSHWFYGNAGERAQIRMNMGWPAFDLYSPSFTLITNVSGMTQIETTVYLPESGQYTLLCKSGSVVGPTGPYRVSVLRLPDVPLSPLDPDVGDILHGQTATGWIFPAADLDAAFFYCEAGKTIVLQKHMGWPAFELYDPDGVLVTNVSGMTQIAATLTLPQTGQYTLLLKSGSVVGPTGEYTVSLTVVGADSLWYGARPAGNDWKRVDWFGFFYDPGGGWIFHPQHEWMYTDSPTVMSIWFWMPSMGWTWTSADSYPWFYRNSDATWLWYTRGTSRPRWFLNTRTGQWEQWW